MFGTFLTHQKKMTNQTRVALFKVNKLINRQHPDLVTLHLKRIYTITGVPSRLQNMLDYQNKIILHNIIYNIVWLSLLNPAVLPAYFPAFSNQQFLRSAYSTKQKKTPWVC